MTPSTKPQIPENAHNKTGRHLGTNTLSLKVTKIDEGSHSTLPSKQVAKLDLDCNKFVLLVDIGYSPSCFPAPYAQAGPLLSVSVAELSSTVASSYLRLLSTRNVTSSNEEVL